MPLRVYSSAWGSVCICHTSSTTARAHGQAVPLSCPQEGDAQSLGAWSAIPNYAIQLSRCLPRVNGVLFTAVAGKDATILLVEITVLLAKDTMEPVPPAEMKKGPYFIIPKKAVGCDQS